MNSTFQVPLKTAPLKTIPPNIPITSIAETTANDNIRGTRCGFCVLLDSEDLLLFKHGSFCKAGRRGLFVVQSYPNGMYTDL